MFLWPWLLIIFCKMVISKTYLCLSASATAFSNSVSFLISSLIFCCLATSCSHQSTAPSPACSSVLCPEECLASGSKGLESPLHSHQVFWSVPQHYASLPSLLQLYQETQILLNVICIPSFVTHSWRCHKCLVKCTPGSVVWLPPVRHQTGSKPQHSLNQ